MVDSRSAPYDLHTREPLAARMRPRQLDEFAGQEHILGEGRLLRRAIQADQLGSLIFHGPPGTGKTTLAMLIAEHTKCHFMFMNAVLAGIAQIRSAIEEAQSARKMLGQRSMLFIDEVHRFNKTQQDALLPHVESGLIVLIGATTENPYFEVNKALVSRSRIFELKSLDHVDMQKILDRALHDKIKGYGQFNITMEEDARQLLITSANGDARNLLNALELAVESHPGKAGGEFKIELATVEDSIQKKAVLYDKDGDAHYDIVSAFIKSIRGSDADAALYWLARMLKAGEDPGFIFRRMAISASEDIGLADPGALGVVMDSLRAFEFVGLPEGRYHLSQACLYLCNAPKSNSTMALFAAMEAVERDIAGEVPDHLKDASRDGKDFGHGKGYKYPHAYQDHWVAQQYLPGHLQDKVFYQPGLQGDEARHHDAVARRREATWAVLKEKAFQFGGDISDAVSNWRGRALENNGERVQWIAAKMLELADIRRDDLILDMNPLSGLLLSECLRISICGGVHALVRDGAQQDYLTEHFKEAHAFNKPHFILPHELQNKAQPMYDVMLLRHHFDEGHELKEILGQYLPLLRPRGRWVDFEFIYGQDQRIHHLLPDSALPGELMREFADCEELFFASDLPRFKWNVQQLKNYNHPGLRLQDIQQHELVFKRRFTKRTIEDWFSPAGKLGHHLESLLPHSKVEMLSHACIKHLSKREVLWKRMALMCLWVRE